MATDPGPLDDDLIEAIRTYNAGRYLEAHELFEQIWMTKGGAEKIFYQGLVHLAMGLHYAATRDAGRASAKLRRAGELLQDFAPDFLGFDLDQLRRSVAACLARLAALGPADAARLEADLALRLQPHRDADRA
jgi:hypothetical protein